MSSVISEVLGFSEEMHGWWKEVFALLENIDNDQYIRVPIHKADAIQHLRDGLKLYMEESGEDFGE